MALPQANDQEASMPLITVIISTYNRSDFLSYSIRSVLNQTFIDYELLVIGDGCTDDSAEVVKGFTDSRVQWINLERNTGSQAGPNNEGLRRAKGQYIAYLGHDDVWMPNHLSSLNQIFVNSLCAVAVSGCVFHGPVGTNLEEVTGIFDDSQDAFLHFFPPSSIAHKKSIIDAIRGWRDPADTQAPVDVDFLLRIVNLGYQFNSTKQLTVHKFAAGHRYLSYLFPSSIEQKTMLEKIEKRAISSKTCEDIVERAISKKSFMTMVYQDYSELAPGLSYYRSKKRKGLELPQLKKLESLEYVPVDGDGSLELGLDWYAPELNNQNQTYFRWSGPSLRPKIPIAYLSDQPAFITLYLSDPFNLLNEISIQLNFKPIEFNRVMNKEGWYELSFIANLHEHSFSVIELIIKNSFCPEKNNISSDVRDLGIIFKGYTVQLLKERVAQIPLLENQIVHSNNAREQAISMLDRARSELAVMTQERDQTISLYTAVKTELKIVISEKEAYLNSTSWKVTKPLRLIKNWFFTSS